MSLSSLRFCGGIYYITQARLELKSLLSESLERWDYRYVQDCLASWQYVFTCINEPCGLYILTGVRQCSTFKCDDNLVSHSLQ